MNLFSLNVTSMEIQRERVSSSQNEHKLGGGGGCSKTKTNKDEQGGRGGQNLVILSECTF